MEPLRVVLAEDHVTVRESLRLLLEREPDLLVVAEAGNGREAIACVEGDEAVDVVVMDLSMPDTSGVVATRHLRDQRPELPIVVLTRHTDKTYLHDMLRAGVAGYVLKQSESEHLIQAIRTAAAGGQFVDPALAAPVTTPPPGHGASQRRNAPTARELDVLRLSARGFSNKELAQRLAVSVKTIEAHKANAMRKLHLHDRIGLLQFALLQGWLNEA